MLGVLPPMFEPVLQQIRLPGLFSFVVKRATSLVFNSVCSKVAKKFILSRFFVSGCTITNQENTAVKQKKFAKAKQSSLNLRLLLSLLEFNDLTKMLLIFFLVFINLLICFCVDGNKTCARTPLYMDWSAWAQKETLFQQEPLDHRVSAKKSALKKWTTNVRCTFWRHLTTCLIKPHKISTLAVWSSALTPPGLVVKEGKGHSPKRTKEEG